MPSQIAANSQANARNMTAFDMVKNASPNRGIATVQNTPTGKQPVMYSKNKQVSAWRVGGYHVLNLLTLGISGAAGSLCAKSHAMGSQQSNSTQHFGDSHLAATRTQANDSGGTKALKWMARKWTGLGRVLLSPIALIQNKCGPGMRELNAAMKNDNLPTNFGTRGVNSASVQAKDTVLKGMANELDTTKKNINSRIRAFDNPHNIQQPQDYTSGHTRHCMTNASPSLKKCMFSQAEKEFATENVMFLQFSTNTLKTNDPDSIDYDPNAAISKKEMLDCYDNFIVQQSGHEINLSYSVRRDAVNTLNPDNQGQVFGDYKARLQGAQQEVTDAAAAVENNELNAGQRLQIARDNLKTIENETFNTIENQQVVGQLKKMDHEIYRINDAMMKRMVTENNIPTQDDIY